MKKITVLLIALTLVSCSIGAGENSKILAGKNGFFPQVSGIDLEGKKRELPKSFDKEINLVVVAFKREQQENVNGWIAATKEILAKNPKVGFYEVPVIYEVSAPYRTFINNGMRRGVVDLEARKHTITVYTNREEFFKILQMKKEKIYLLMMNKEGKILQRIEGDATKENVALLRKKLLKLSR